MLGVLEKVVVGHLEPDPRSVLVLQALPDTPAGPWMGEHLHPVVDRQRVVVGMDELEGPLAEQLIGGPPKDLGHLIGDADDEAALVLADRRETRRSYADHVPRVNGGSDGR